MVNLPARQSAGNMPANPQTQFDNHAPQTHASQHTWGCLAPIEIQPLDALLDDIKRTQAHILWLEAFIAQLPTHAPFTSDEHFMAADSEQAMVGKPSLAQVGSVKWQLQMQKQREQRGTTSRPATHPAITQLQAERRHLADAVYKATILGIKLDAIDYSRQQADLIIMAMGKFAIAQGLKPTDPTVAEQITTALEQVLAEQQAT